MFGNIREVRKKWPARRFTPRLRLHATRRDSLTKYVAGHTGQGSTRGACHGENNFPAGNHWAGSTALRYCRALTFSNFCTTPEGHRISISLALESWPRPAITRLSLAER